MSPLLHCQIDPLAHSAHCSIGEKLIHSLVTAPLKCLGDRYSQLLHSFVCIPVRWLSLYISVSLTSGLLLNPMYPISVCCYHPWMVQLRCFFVPLSTSQNGNPANLPQPAHITSPCPLPSIREINVFFNQSSTTTSGRWTWSVPSFLSFQLGTIP